MRPQHFIFANQVFKGNNKITDRSASAEEITSYLKNDDNMDTTEARSLNVCRQYFSILNFSGTMDMGQNKDRKVDENNICIDPPTT